jgi:valyl-tRNA synthetase
MPFITETLWKRLPGRAAEASISVAPWPRTDARAHDAKAGREFGTLQELVGAIRSIRAEYGVQPGQTVRATVSNASRAVHAALRQLKPTVLRLAKLSALQLATGETTDDHRGAGVVLSDGTVVTVPLGDLVDLDKECARLRGETDRLLAALSAQEKKLANQQFVSRAPAEVVAREREKLTAWREQAGVLAAKRERLGCAG